MAICHYHHSCCVKAEFVRTAFIFSARYLKRCAFLTFNRGPQMQRSTIDRRKNVEDEIQMLERMDARGVPLSRQSIYVALQGCTRKKDLSASRRVYALMMKSGLDSVAALSNQLIRLFAENGKLQEAVEVFGKISVPTVHSWNALISAHLKQGDNEEVLLLYREMQTHVKPDEVTFLFILKACITIRSLIQGHIIHDSIMRSAFDSNVLICNSLIDMYAKFGTLAEAEFIFRNLSKPTLISWGAMILGYSTHGQGFTAINQFEKMQEVGMHPDKVIFLGLTRACVNIGSVEKGRGLHHLIVSFGFDSDAAVANSLLDMYAKCGCFDEAQKVFDNLSLRSLVSWSALISGYVQHGYAFLALELFEKMKEEAERPDKITYICILRACGSLDATEKGRYIHEEIMKSELNSDMDVLNAVIDMYAKCRNLKEAQEVFNKLRQPNTMSWEPLIGGYVFEGDSFSAFKSIERMLQDGLRLSEVILSHALQACSNVKAIDEGRLIHHQLCKDGFSLNVTANTLIDMYAKCGNLKEAHQVFDKLLNRDIISWSTLIAGYVQQGQCEVALDLFQKMNVKNVPNKTAFSSAVKACGKIGALAQARLMHDDIVKIGYEIDIIIGSSIVDMYVRCKCLDEARQVFDNLHNRDTVSWASMVAGYVYHGYCSYALDFYKRMLYAGLKPDKVTILCVLKACGSAGSIEHGNLVFDHIIRDGSEHDATLQNAVIDMYVKCGRLENAHKVLIELPIQNVVSWGAIISGYAEQGDFKMVQLYLDNMHYAGIRPDDVIFTNILDACSHAGKLTEGQFYFNLMKEQYRISPNAEQYSCMIDLLGRAGCFKEAEDYLDSFPGTPDFVTWVSLLSCCRLYGNVDLGKRCFDQVSKLISDDASGYVLMSNIFVENQLWEEVD